MTTLSEQKANMRELTTFCGKCLKKPRGEDKFKVCSRCKSISYCCVDCQKTHWKEHKPNCSENMTRTKTKQLRDISILLFQTCKDQIMAAANQCSKEAGIEKNDIVIKMNITNIKSPLDNAMTVIKEMTSEDGVDAKPYHLSDFDEQTQKAMRKVYGNDRDAFCFSLSHNGICFNQAITKYVREEMTTVIQDGNISVLAQKSKQVKFSNEERKNRAFDFLTTCLKCQKQPKGGKEYKRCLTCKSVFYCSHECRNAHAEEHKLYCEERDVNKLKQLSGISFLFFGCCKEDILANVDKFSIESKNPKNDLVMTIDISDTSSSLDDAVKVVNENMNSDGTKFKFSSLYSLDKQTQNYLMGSYKGEKDAFAFCIKHQDYSFFVPVTEHIRTFINH